MKLSAAGFEAVVQHVLLCCSHFEDLSRHVSLPHASRTCRHGSHEGNEGDEGTAGYVRLRLAAASEDAGEGEGFCRH